MRRRVIQAGREVESVAASLASASRLRQSAMRLSRVGISFTVTGLGSAGPPGLRKVQQIARFPRPDGRGYFLSALRASGFALGQWGWKFQRRIGAIVGG